jgi:hypothetical protein
MIVATIGRYCFALKVWAPTKLMFPLSFLGATATYVAFFGLVAIVTSYAL